MFWQTMYYFLPWNLPVVLYWTSPLHFVFLMNMLNMARIAQHHFVRFSVHQVSSIEHCITQSSNVLRHLVRVFCPPGLFYRTLYHTQLQCSATSCQGFLSTRSLLLNIISHRAPMFCDILSGFSVHQVSSIEHYISHSSPSPSTHLVL